MSRETIFGKVRAALASGPSAEARKEAAAARLAAPVRHLIPDRAKRPRAELVSSFIARMKASAATVIEVDALSAVPAAVSTMLTEAGLPPRLRLGQDAGLAELFRSLSAGDSPPSHGERAGVREHGTAGLSLSITEGAAEPDDGVGLSRALAGIAETGTLVLASSAENPATLAYLPETHIALVARESIAGSMEDAFAIVRAAWGRHVMPRALMLISGPSRTGDIGGRIVLGAHGPRRLIVVVYG